MEWKPIIITSGILFALYLVLEIFICELFIIVIHIEYSLPYKTAPSLSTKSYYKAGGRHISYLYNIILCQLKMYCYIYVFIMYKIHLHTCTQTNKLI